MRWLRVKKSVALTSAGIICLVAMACNTGGGGGSGDGGGGNSGQTTPHGPNGQAVSQVETETWNLLVGKKLELETEVIIRYSNSNRDDGSKQPTAAEEIPDEESDLSEIYPKRLQFLSTFQVKVNDKYLCSLSFYEKVLEAICPTPSTNEQWTLVKLGLAAKEGLLIRLGYDYDYSFAGSKVYARMEYIYNQAQ